MMLKIWHESISNLLKGKGERFAFDSIERSSREEEDNP